MTLQKLSALECPEVPSPTREREPEAVPCVLLQAGALPSDAPDANESPPSPAAPEPAVEDESADPVGEDPVGDGHSDAELAQKLTEVPREVPRPGEPTAPGNHPPPADEEMGR